MNIYEVGKTIIEFINSVGNLIYPYIKEILTIFTGIIEFTGKTLAVIYNNLERPTLNIIDRIQNALNILNFGSDFVLSGGFRRWLETLIQVPIL